MNKGIGNQGFWKQKIICGVVLCMIALTVLFFQSGNPVLEEVKTPEELYTYSKEVVYFGRDTCTYCDTAVRVMEPILKGKKAVFRYFNTDRWREHEQFENILNDFKIDEVPTLVYIENGQCVESTPMFDDSGKMDPGLIEEMLRHK